MTGRCDLLYTAALWLLTFTRFSLPAIAQRVQSLATEAVRCAGHHLQHVCKGHAEVLKPTSVHLPPGGRDTQPVSTTSSKGSSSSISTNNSTSTKWQQH